MQVYNLQSIEFLKDYSLKILFSAKVFDKGKRFGEKVLFFAKVMIRYYLQNVETF